MKKLLLFSLSSVLLLGACGQMTNDDKDNQHNTTTEQAKNDHRKENHESDGHNHQDHNHEDHDIEVTVDTVVDKEDDHYIVAHGDHYHEVPISDVSKDDRQKIDENLKAHPNLKKEHEKKQEIQAGNFEDAEVSDRELSDWEGDWQSVYPYLEDGTLDPVMEMKALESDGKKDADEYKDYYETGYKTDVKSIKIHGDEITFIKNDGSEVMGKYKADGYEVLHYEAGNKGVRQKFTKVGGDDEAYQSVQFSDHNIGPTDDVMHFHLYFSNDSHDELLKEIDNWPTYYPQSWNGDQILEDQLHH